MIDLHLTKAIDKNWQSLTLGGSHYYGDIIGSYMDGRLKFGNNL